MEVGGYANKVREVSQQEADEDARKKERKIRQEAQRRRRLREAALNLQQAKEAENQVKALKAYKKKKNVPIPPVKVDNHHRNANKNEYNHISEESYQSPEHLLDDRKVSVGESSKKIVSHRWTEDGFMTPSNAPSARRQDRIIDTVHEENESISVESGNSKYEGATSLEDARQLIHQLRQQSRAKAPGAKEAWVDDRQQTERASHRSHSIHGYNDEMTVSEDQQSGRHSHPYPPNRVETQAPPSNYSQPSTLTTTPSIETPHSSYAHRRVQKHVVLEKPVHAKPLKHSRDWGIKPETEAEKQKRLHREKAKEYARLAREKAQREAERRAIIEQADQNAQEMKPEHHKPPLPLPYEEMSSHSNGSHQSKIPPPQPLQVEEFTLEYKAKHGRPPTTLSMEEAKLQASLQRLDVALESVSDQRSESTHSMYRCESGVRPKAKKRNSEGGGGRVRTAVGVTNR